MDQTFQSLMKRFELRPGISRVRGRPLEGRGRMVERQNSSAVEKVGKMSQGSMESQLEELLQNWGQ
jgi:hypothetical protein